MNCLVPCVRAEDVNSVDRQFTKCLAQLSSYSVCSDLNVHDRGLCVSYHSQVCQPCSCPVISCCCSVADSRSYKCSYSTFRSMWVVYNFTYTSISCLAGRGSCTVWFPFHRYCLGHQASGGRFGQLWCRRLRDRLCATLPNLIVTYPVYRAFALGVVLAVTPMAPTVQLVAAMEVRRSWHISFLAVSRFDRPNVHRCGYHERRDPRRIRHVSLLVFPEPSFSLTRQASATSASTEDRGLRCVAVTYILLPGVAHHKPSVGLEHRFCFAQHPHPPLIL